MDLTGSRRSRTVVLFRRVDSEIFYPIQNIYGINYVDAEDHFLSFIQSGDIHYVEGKVWTYEINKHMLIYYCL